MKISELSRRSGVSPRRLRHFEELGLLNPERVGKDYRNYSEEDLERALKIQEFQSLGLTLKEILNLLSNPQTTNDILHKAFTREQISYFEKRTSLHSLRGLLEDQKHLPFKERVAYAISDLDKIILNRRLEKNWKSDEVIYIQFSHWQPQSKAGVAMVGEMIWQSAFYALVADGSLTEEDLEKFIGDFFRSAHAHWPTFEGHPPKPVELESLEDFFSPREIVLQLGFNSLKGARLDLLLPYQALFSISKASISPSKASTE